MNEMKIFQGGMNLKKAISLVVLMLLLSGCSLIEGINNTLDYVNEATTYIDEVSHFANTVPALAEQAATDPQALEDLEQELKNMQSEINEFNSLEPPSVAQELHNTIEGYNQQINAAIESSLEKIDAGQYEFNELMDAELVQTLQKLQNTMNQIEQLGN